MLVKVQDEREVYTHVNPDHIVSIQRRTDPKRPDVQQVVLRMVTGETVVLSGEGGVELVAELEAIG